jgi:hypothetical protein
VFVQAAIYLLPQPCYFRGKGGHGQSEGGGCALVAGAVDGVRRACLSRSHGLLPPFHPQLRLNHGAPHQVVVQRCIQMEHRS